MPRHGRAVAGVLTSAVRRVMPGADQDDGVADLVGLVDGGRDGAGAASLRAAAVQHGIVGCVWSLAKAAGLSDHPRLGALRDAYRSDLARHLRTLAELGQVHETCAAAGVPVYVVKGPVLAEAIYPRPDLRGYADLDVLVAPDRFGAALEALERAGATVYDRNWELMRRRMLGEVRVRTEAGTWLDLHWHLVGDPAARAELAVDQAGVLDRGREIRLAGVPVRTLDPVDTAAHLAVHACLAGANRLVWLLDVALAVDALDSWDPLVERATAWRAGPGVALVLARTSATLGITVPADVRRALCPDRSWRGLVALADRMIPIARTGGARSPARLIARAARGDGGASRRELARRAYRWIRDGAPREDLANRRLFDRDDPESAAYDTGGPAARAEFLAAVRAN